ncbi:MAG: RNA 2',3'-cyclic phosphodiesterase [Desulfobacterales bacterium]
MQKPADHAKARNGDAPIRAFIAVDLPASVSQALQAAQDQLKSHHFDIRWAKPENIHLTLKFLGDIPPADLACILPALGAAAAAVAPFAIAARGAGVFPGIKAPRVVWAGLTGQLPALFALQRSVAQALATAGFPPEVRPFKAHLTLGRFKGRVRPADLLAALQALGQWASPTFRVDRVTIFQSDLRPGGAVYTPLGEAPLNMTERIKLENQTVS